MDTARVPQIVLKVLKVLLILYVNNNVKYVNKFNDLLNGIIVLSERTCKISGGGGTRIYILVKNIRSNRGEEKLNFT